MKLIYQTFDFTTNTTENINSTDKTNKTDNFTDKTLIENLNHTLAENFTSNSTTVKNVTNEIEHAKGNCNKTDAPGLPATSFANDTNSGSGCDNSDEKGFPSYPIVPFFSTFFRKSKK